MRVVCAPDSFKESMTAGAAARAMAEGVRRVAADAVCDLCPVSDGGEGFVEAMLTAAGGQRRVTAVCGPLGEPVDAAWGVLADGSAVIEMAAASGMERVPVDKRDPTRTTTFGTGQLIAAALDEGCRRVLVGIGGSATCDGGAGMAQGLGVRFVDAAGMWCADGLGGGALAAVAGVDRSRVHPGLAGAQVLVACDVTNPLCGPDGSAAVYGPQKGATPAQVRELDGGLAHLAAVCAVDGQRPGFGAAGGLGFGLVVFAGARLRRGIDLVLEAVGFEDRVAGADLCLTGEGRLDGQSLSGKAVLGVARAAERQAVATWALVGAIGEGGGGAEADGRLAGVRVIGPGLTVAESMRRGPELLAEATAALLMDWRGSGRGKGRRDGGTQGGRDGGA